MKIAQAIKMAFKSLGSNKLRSFLTMLGVIIGVTCVALLTTVASGAKTTIVNSLKKESSLVSLMMAPFSGETLSNARLDQVANTIGTDAGEFDYAPYVYGSAVVQIDGQPKTVEPSGPFKKLATIDTTVIASTANLSLVRNFEITGRFFDDGESDACVVDTDFVKAFFGAKVKAKDVLGKTVQLGRTDIQTKIQIMLGSANAEIIEQIYVVASSALKQLGFPESAFVNISESDTSHSWFNNWSGLFVKDTPNGMVMEFLLEQNLILLSSQIDEVLTGALTNFDASFATEDAVVVLDTPIGLGKEFVVVGVIKSQSSFFSSNLNTDYIKNETYLEILKRMDEGEVFVLFDEANIELFSVPSPSVLTLGDFDSQFLSEVVFSFPPLSSVGLAGAHFKFADEFKVEIGASGIMTSLFENGFSVSSFFVISMNTVANIVSDVMNILTIMLSVIAGISLVVGGIGIMNIMLVSVSERTREIGIRKAIGAKKSFILSQFLVEALVVTLIGGVIGVFLSFIGTLIIGSLMGISLIMPLWVIALSLGFCLVIGIVFGMYPAIKAANMKPIDALRRE